MAGLTIRAAIAAMALSVALGGPAAALDKVRAAKAGLTFAFETIDVGQEAKIWDSVGIEIEALQLGGDGPLEKMLTSGDLDVGLSSGPSMGYTVKGVPMIAVAAMAGAPFSFVVIVRPDSPITTIDQLKGKRVAVTSAGSLTDWLTRELARQRGWGPEELLATPLGGNGPEMAALKTGDVDAMVSTTAPALDGASKGLDRVLFSFGDIVKDFHTHVLVATDDFRTKKPEVLKRFLQGWFKTIAYMKANKEATVKIVAKAMGIDEEIAGKAYDSDMRMLSDDGAFNPAAIEVIRNSLPQLGLLPSVPDAKALYNDSFVPVKF
jgi:NitT/TauT family transport system substrate-binding protein